MKEYLVILIKKSYFFEYVKDERIKKIYKDSNKINSICRKITSRIFPTFLSVFFGDWKKELKKCKKVILMDSGYNSKIASYIKKINPNIKIIFYYWNVITDKNSWIMNEKYIDEFWTFDEQDAKKYNLKFSPQFYYQKEELTNLEYKYDVCYLGAAKDRESEILEIESKLKKEKLETNIIISHSGDKLKTYDEYLEMINESRAILDVVGKSQIGITLRCLESIFFEKKLITNNMNIINYPFYNKKNIFIIGKDDISQINNFLNESYEKNSEEVVKLYSYEKWLENLLKKGE